MAALLWDLRRPRCPALHHVTSQLRPEIFTPRSTVHLDVLSKTHGKSDASGGKGGRKTTKVSMCSIPPVTCLWPRAKRSYIYTKMINIQSFQYKTQLEILCRLLSFQWLWHSLSLPFQCNAALLIFLQNAPQRLLGFDDVTFFNAAFHCISACYYIKH